jgi:transcriptional regulator with XRE-family HTH domain
MNFGEQLKEIRSSKGLTQIELSEKSGIALRTVQRIIGMKMGTGGSSGAPFLQKALELTFFPELFAVRTAIGK